MTKPINEDSHYLHLQGAISNALPLEYAIRASQVAYAPAMSKLRRLDKRLKAELIKLGATPEEIDKEDLADFVWDFMQFGIPLVRRHDRELHPEIEEIVALGMKAIPEVLNWFVEDSKLPALGFFRACDLLRGNDSSRLLKNAGIVYAHSRTPVERGAEGKVLRWFNVREPVRVHPAVRYKARHDLNGILQFRIERVPSVEISDFELERQYREFNYMQAVRRQLIHGIEDRLAKEAIGEYLRSNQTGRWSENRVKRHDGFARRLSGLYCWDLHHTKGLRLQDAYEDTLAAYPVGPDSFKTVDIEAIEKNYKITNREIRILVRKWKDCQMDQWHS